MTDPTPRRALRMLVLPALLLPALLVAAVLVAVPSPGVQTTRLRTVAAPRPDRVGFPVPGDAVLTGLTMYLMIAGLAAAVLVGLALHQRAHRPG